MHIIKITIYFFLISFVFLGTSKSENNDIYNGKILLKDLNMCDEIPDHYKCGRAASIIKGFARRLIQGRMGDMKNKNICINDRLAVSELMNIVKSYLINNPQEHKKIAMWIIQDAVISRYPCR